MDYVRQYKSFITSHYLSQGLRITFGITLPAVILSYFNLLSVGIVVSLGAMSVSITDNPGPVHHRRNGMYACTILNFIVALVSGWLASYPVALGIFIFTSCFIFSMIGVYGSRATSIGLSALLVLVLNIDHAHKGVDNLYNATYILAGGLWYTLLSLLLYSIRPYRLTQQALGDCMLSTADYLRIKASFYNEDVDYQKAYERLALQQADLHQKQDLIRELLFKSRNLVKDSTNMSRILAMMFLDVVDLFERVMTSHQDYRSLHKYFHGTDIMERFRNVIMQMADELEEIGIAVQSNRSSAETDAMRTQMAALENYFTNFRDQHRNPSNVEGFIALRQILENLQDISGRLHTLHSYTSYDKSLTKSFDDKLNFDQFITHQDITPQMLWQNLTYSSNTFRHAIRISLATVAGYIISKFFPFGHGYWILLTIIVILKPAYSLTKKRNAERLWGTIAGALIGILLIYFIKDRHVLLACMIVLMIGTYSFLRIQYLVSVLFMTPYILLLFHLLDPNDFNLVVKDRLVDTLIGSAIAFIANIFIVPAWEHEQIQEYMGTLLKQHIDYFKETTAGFLGEQIDIQHYKLTRKHILVALANLSEAFNRMLSEPKRKQKNIRQIHQFVMLNHMLTSHIATLAYYAQTKKPDTLQQEFKLVIDDITQRLEHAAQILNGGPTNLTEPIARDGLRKLNDYVNRLVERRKAELSGGITESDTRKELASIKTVADQFNFISNIATDLEKLSAKLRQIEGVMELKPVLV